MAADGIVHCGNDKRGPYLRQRQFYAFVFTDHRNRIVRADGNTHGVYFYIQVLQARYGQQPQDIAGYVFYAARRLAFNTIGGAS